MSTAAIAPENGNRGVGTELRIFLYKQQIVFCVCAFYLNQYVKQLGILKEVIQE